MTKTRKPLSPMMQRLYQQALETGYTAGNTNTIVALMDRGLIREQDHQRRHALATDRDAVHATALIDHLEWSRWARFDYLDEPTWADMIMSLRRQWSKS